MRGNPPIPMIGKIFGRLLCVRRVPRLNGDSHYRYAFICGYCGTEFEAIGKNVRTENTTSCGCQHKEQLRARSTTHGHAAGLKRNKLTPEYRSWKGMLQRCLDENSTGYRNYGGRGILVCERWHRFSNFLADMGHRPNGCSLDRIDSNGNYEPGNCRWVTPAQQSRNTKRNVWITYNGKTKVLRDWALEVGMHSYTLWDRLFIQDLPFGEAISKPVKGKSKKEQL